MASVQARAEGWGEGNGERGKLFYLQLELFCLQLRFFAYSPLTRLLDALSSHCKQKLQLSAKKN